MKVLVWTLQEFEATALRIAGRDAHVVSFPSSGKTPMPMPTSTTPAPGCISTHYDLVYVFLHPSADGRAFTDGAGRVVVRPEMISTRSDLRGAVVFLGACHGIENTTLLDAFREAGVAAIIAAPGVNYGGGFAGADVLALALRLALQAGLPARAAFAAAKRYTALAGRAGAQQVGDALEYQLLPGQPVAETPLKKPALWNKIITAVSGVMGLVLLLLGLVLGWLAPGPLTQFSPLSPLPLPTEIYTWDKTLYVSGTATDTVPALDFAYSAIVTDTDTVTVVDAVVVNPYYSGFGPEVITYTLAERWSDSLALDTFTHTVGSVVTGTRAMTWTVGTDLAEAGLITRTWTVVPGAWTWDAITETLTVSTTNAVKTVYLGHVGACLPPVALALESDYDYLNQTDTFTAWALGSEPLTYTWAFGDGNSDTTGISTTTHVYTATGTFYPAVEIVGCSGITDTVSTTVHIAAETPTPTSTTAPTNTPSPTLTPTPTPTPRYTPRPWPTVSYPTATPCVGFGCEPLDEGALLHYRTWLPLIFYAYSP